MNIINKFSKKYNNIKNKSTNISEKFPKFYKTRNKIEECFNFVSTTYHQNTITNQEANEIDTYTCKNKFCEVCSSFKRQKWKLHLENTIYELKEFEGQRFIFLTLTIKNCNLEDLSTTIKHMNESWRRMWHNSLKYRMNGFHKNLEITFKKDKEGKLQCHPHFHILISVDNSYFKNKFSNYDISDIWQNALKVDYTPIIDIRAIKGDKEKIDKSLKELIKYPMKSTDLDNLTSSQMVELDLQLNRKRFIANGGNLKCSIKDIEDSIEPQDLTLEGWEEIGEITYSYYYKKGYIPKILYWHKKEEIEELQKEIKKVYEEFEIDKKLYNEVYKIDENINEILKVLKGG